METISMYTLDTEGEVKDEELIVEGILISTNGMTFIHVFDRHYLGFLLASKTPIITEITKPIRYGTSPLFSFPGMFHKFIFRALDSPHDLHSSGLPIHTQL